MNGSPQKRCGYTYPKNHKLGDGPARQNCCWRETAEGLDQCIWHANPDKRGKSVEDLNKTRISKEIQNQYSGYQELLDGAKLKNLDLRDSLPFHQVSLRSAELAESNLSNISFSGSNLEDSNISDVHASVADFSDTNLKHTNIAGANFAGANISNSNLLGATISGTSFARADFSKASLSGLDLSDISLSRADLTETSLYQTDLSNANLKNANLTNIKAHEADFSNGNLKYSTLSGAHLTNANLTGVDLTNAELQSANLGNADLTGGTLTNAKFTNGNLEQALLSRSNLFKTDLRGTKIHGSILGDARIDADTKFLGPSGDGGVLSPHTRTAIFSKPCCVYDPNYSDENEPNPDKAKSVYQAIEELARRTAQTRLQSQCFVRRQDIQKNTYKTVLLNGPRQDSNEDTQEESESETETADSQSSLQSKCYSLEVRAIAGMRYARAKTARVSLLYGESPWRIISWSVGFIVAIALVYPLNEWLRPIGEEPITYSRIAEEPTLFLESLYFSTLTFTTLGLGDYEPLGLGQAIATLNTAFGAILIALLVFVFGRRASR